MVLIDGKKVSGEIRNRLADETQKLKKKTGKTPGLATVLVGDDPASAVYVRNKNKICGELGFRTTNEFELTNTLNSELSCLSSTLTNLVSVS